MASISLKVHLCSQQTVKTLQFDYSTSVHDACQEIRRKLGDAVGGEDHALFWPAKSKWLQPNKALAFYELAPGETVEFKKRHRMLRIRLLDETVKTVLIDDSLPVLLLAQSICSKIGIANQDEYSLALEEQVDVTKGAKKKAVDSIDNVTWLNPEKSLPEQGVEESATLLLKKKFFYSDQNVDRTDPIQLHLIYQQSRDGIISGKHACTVEESIQFAALQMQIVHGNHDDAKHKLGFLNLREFLPEEYRKAKDIERRIYAEHRKLINMPELTVKHRYVQLCRSLKTYGVTFFSVKEKDVKKNKVVARMIGISKDAILRCDAETKEVLQTWPLTSLRRWAASPTMFTMDFGDYQDAFYSVQTNQGEQMSQLIAGYIDIIIKRKKEADRVISTGEEEVITTEEVVRPARAQAIAIKPAQVNTAQEIVFAQQGELASEGANAATVGQAAMRTTHQAAMSSIQPVSVNFVNPGSPDPGVAAVLQRVNAGQSAVQALVTDMTLSLALPVSSIEVLPTDPARLFAQTTVLAHLASHLAAVSALVQATSAVDMPAMAHHVGQLSTNLSSLGAATKTLHANGAAAGQLPELTRDIAHATSRLLTTVQESVTAASPTREALLAAAQSVTTASVALLAALNYPSPSHPPAGQRKLQEAAKHVSVAMQDLVNKAKRVAGEMGTKEAQMRLIEHVKLGASAASQVAVSSAILAPLAATSICKQRLTESANSMRSTVDVLVSGAAASVSSDSENLNNLRLSAQAVSDALDALLLMASGVSAPSTHNDAPESTPDVTADDAVLTQLCSKVRAGCAAVQNALGGEPGGIVAGVKSLTMSSTELVNALKKLAAVAPDESSRNTLVDGAKALAEATTRMVSAAKESARNPQDSDKQDAVKAALDSILAALQVIQHPDSATVTDMLAATQSLVVSSVVLACDPNVVNASQLAPLARKVLESVREHSVVAASYGPGVSPRPIMNSSRALADSVQVLLMAAMQVPEVAVASAAQVCAQDVHTVGSHVGKVASLANALELAAVAQTVSQLKAQTVVPTSSAQQFRPLDLAAVKTACKDLGSTLAQLVGNTTQGKETGEAATKVQAAITSVVQASSGMPEAERSLVVNLLDQSLSLLSRVQNAPRDKAALADDVKALNGSVVKLIEGATHVAATKRETTPLPGPTVTASAPVPVQVVVTKDSTREAVVGASSAMVTAISQLVTAKSVSGDIKKATSDLESAFRQLVSASKLVIPQANSHAKAEILELVQAASSQCVELIGSARQQASAQPTSPSREVLSNAASTLGASVNKLMEKCAVVGSLGDVEVIRAMQALEMAAARLASPMLPTKIGDLTFSECLGKVVDDARQIAQIMSTALKAPSANTTSPSASAVSGVSNSASSSSSSPSAPIDPATVTQLCQVVASIADTAMFAAAILSSFPITSLQPLHTDINRDLSLLESATTQQAVLDAASGVGAATNGMCALIKDRAASLSVTEQERAELVEMATSLASASQHLIHAVKSYAVNMNEETKAVMVQHIQPVRSASDKVYAFSTEAAGPIRAAARKVVESGRNIVLTSDRARAVQHATALGHHLSGMVTSLRDVAPGQRELAAAIDQVQTSIAGVDEQLLASAVEGTKVTLGSNPPLVEECRALNRIVFGWTTESARIERDPARPIHAAESFVKITRSIPDSAIFELVKSFGNGLLRVMDNLKFSRPPDALPAVEVGEDLVAILELQNQLHERVVSPLSDSDSAEVTSPDTLQEVQNAAKDLVALISKCKTPTGFRTGQFAPQLVGVFDRLCQVAKSCEEKTNDVVIRDRLHGSLERLGAAVVGVLLDRSKVSQLSSAIQALVATIQESVRAAAQCLAAQQFIASSLLPTVRETISKIDAGESVQVGPVAPGALQLRCNQLLESLNALVTAAESNMDTTLGDAAEGSIVILKNLVEDSRKHAVAQQSTDTLKTVDEILGLWSTLVQVTSRAVTKPPSDPIFESTRELANKISRLTTALTSNESQQEFQKLASVLEAAIKALPTFENELRGHENGAENGAEPTPENTKSAEEWEKVRNIKETRAVAMTTFDLLKTAALCQREVSVRSPQTPAPTSPTSGAKYMDDGTWSDGFVSAAKQVSEAMQELIAMATPAGDGAQPPASRERLIACAKAVASATVQVVAAASVKSDANAPSLVQLKAHAKTVVQTAEAMVNKIKTSNEVDKGLGQDLLALKPSNQTSARLALLEAQTNVLTMEAELERARARLNNIKKARYAGQPDGPAQ